MGNATVNLVATKADLCQLSPEQRKRAAQELIQEASSLGVTKMEVVSAKSGAGVMHLGYEVIMEQATWMMNVRTLGFVCMSVWRCVYVCFGDCVYAVCLGVHERGVCMCVRVCVLCLNQTQPSRASILAFRAMCIKSTQLLPI